MKYVKIVPLNIKFANALKDRYDYDLLKNPSIIHRRATAKMSFMKGEEMFIRLDAIMVMGRKSYLSDKEMIDIKKKLDEHLSNLFPDLSIDDYEVEFL
jgi:L-2-hydroxyglutarate oxidase LhgO